MAAGLLRRELAPDGERIVAESAGTAAWEGQPATEPTLQVAEREGVDLGSHRSRRVTPAMVPAADLILVLGPGQLSAGQTPVTDRSRTHLLSEYPPPGEASPGA